MKQLTKAEVISRVTEIRRIRQDHELAHAKEDALYLDVLKAIASGTCEDPRAIARVAVATEKIKFYRGKA